jgi:alpha-amylase
MVRAKEAGLENLLVYDPYRRVSLRDHFLGKSTSAHDLWGGRHPELGDFATGAYDLKLDAKKGTVILSRAGTIKQGQASFPATVRKTIALQPRATFFEIRYDVTFHGSERVTCLFGVEFAVNLLSGASFDRYYRSDDADLHYARLGEMGCDEGLSHIALRDDWQHLDCGFRFSEAAARVYRFGIETVSQSEGGQERVYQGSVVVPCWEVELTPGQSFSRTIMAEVTQS